MVIGGGAAGMSAASAARRVAPSLDVVVCEAGGFAAYGMCGIPYFLGGTVPRAEDLLAYPPGEFRDKRGIDLRLHTRVTAIDPAARQVHLSGEAGSGPLRYDALVVASGADPVRPPVPGLDGPRVFTIRSLDEAIGLRRLLDSGTVRRAIVVGAGYIGLEAAEALVSAGARGGGGRGAAPGAGQRGRAGRRAGPGGAGAACPAAARRPAGRGADADGSGPAASSRCVDGTEIRHRPGGHRGRGAPGHRPADPGGRGAPAGPVGGGRREHAHLAAGRVRGRRLRRPAPSGAGPPGLGAARARRPTRPAGWPGPWRPAAPRRSRASSARRW